MTNQENESLVVESAQSCDSDASSATLLSGASENSDPVALSDETEKKTSSDFCTSNNQDVVILPPPTEFSDRQVDDKVETEVLTVTDGVDETTAISLEVEPKTETMTESSLSASDSSERLIESEKDPAAEPTLDEKVNDAESSSGIISEEIKESGDTNESVAEIDDKLAKNDVERELTVDDSEAESTENVSEEEPLVNDSEHEPTAENVEEEPTIQTAENDSAKSEETSVPDEANSETHEAKLNEKNSPTASESTFPVPARRVNVTIEPRKPLMSHDEKPEKKIFDLIKQFEDLSMKKN